MRNFPPDAGTLKESAIVVTDSPGQLAWLREIEAYAELAIEAPALHAPNNDADLDESREMLCVIRDVLNDLRDIPGANDAVAEAYRTVRKRAGRKCAAQCPWSIDTLITAASRL